MRSESRDRHVEHLLRTGGAKSPRGAHSIMRCGELGGSKHARARARARSHTPQTNERDQSICQLAYRKCQLYSNIGELNYPIKLPIHLRKGVGYS